MTELKKVGFSDRISQAQEAKKALLAKMKTKPAVQDPDFDRREELRAAEVEAIRARRQAEKEARAQAKAEALQAVALTAAEQEQAALDAKRQERKDRKAAEKAEARAKKEARRNGTGRPDSDNNAAW
jgi:hypothetical protein